MRYETTSRKARHRWIIKAAAVAVLAGGASAGAAEPCVGDLDGSEAIDFGDLLIVLSEWGQCSIQHEISPADCETGDHFGHSVAATSSTLIVGSPLADHSGLGEAGVAYSFEWNGTAWVERQTIDAFDAAADDEFGWSAAISWPYLVIGARNQNSDTGKAYVFKNESGYWLDRGQPYALDGAPGDQFGRAVAISDSAEWIIVGAPFDDNEVGSNAGAAYIYRYDGFQFVFHQKLTWAGQDDDYFGSSVAISDTWAVVGASGDDWPLGVDAGAAYIFRWNGSTWEYEIGAVGDAGDRVGSSVSLHGDHVLVGAAQNGVGDGYAALLRYDGDWDWLQTVTASDAATQFGYSVTMGATSAVIGARGSNAAYAYDLHPTGNSLINEQKLSGQPGEDFGFSTALAGTGVVVVARKNGDLGTEAGMVYAERPACGSDLDGDGDVGFGDLLTILSTWGPCP